MTYIYIKIKKLTITNNIIQSLYQTRRFTLAYRNENKYIYIYINQ